MLHSKYYNKDTYEDPKTSAVFENLMLLPDNVFWSIVRNSCFDVKILPVNSGRLLSYCFWPHWISKGKIDNVQNSYFVEPDLFLRFEEFDVIIEAKYGEQNGQNAYQWWQEIIAYGNEYGFQKPFYFIAVGGNVTVDTETVKAGNKSIPIYKCSWLSILINVDRYAKELGEITIPDYNLSATCRLLNNIVLAFNVNGVYDIKWFDTMEQQNTTISPLSIKYLSDFFKNNNYE